MKKPALFLSITAAAIAVCLGSYVVLDKEGGEPQLPLINEPAKETVTYTSSEHGFSFEHSPNFYLKERKDDPQARAQLALVLVEDTEENRDLVEGRSTQMREGPTNISIEVYPNPDSLPAEDWVRADTNWTVRTSDAAPIGRGSITGVTYSWDGLYAGKSVIVTEGTHAYVFSVTWASEGDPVLAEFDRILSSVTITPEA